MEQRWRSALKRLVPVFFSSQDLQAIEAKIASEPGSDIETMISSEEHPLKLAMALKDLLPSPAEKHPKWRIEFDKLLVDAWTLQMQLSRDASFFPEYIPSCTEWLPAEDNLDRMVVSESLKRDRCYLGDYGQLKLVATSGYGIGDEYVALAGSAPVDDWKVTVLGADRNNDMSVVLRVIWNGEVWWLKLGPEAETRQRALDAPDDDELPAGAWERWFQTERDMLSRSLLGNTSGMEAFAVAVEAARSRSAMLVKDAGDSLKKRLLATQRMEAAQVYEMSKQVYAALEASGKQGVIHGDVCLENICEKDGTYSLIDWGLACGRPFERLAAAVGKAWPALDVMNQTPGIPNWEMSANCCFLGVRPWSIQHDLESLLYCCMKLLGGSVLPWSDAAASGSELDVLNVRAATVAHFVKAHGRYIYRPLLLRLSLVSAQEFTAKDKPGMMISASAAQESEVSAKYC